MSAADSFQPSKSDGRGAVAVLAMLGVAILAATFAWWWNFDRGRRTLDLYGPEAATLVRTAPKVELLGHPNGDIDISKAPGLLNARTSLLSDPSYEWTSSETPFDASQYAVRFSRDGRSATVFFDFENQSINIAPNCRNAKLSKKTADGWRAYIERQVKDKSTKLLAPGRMGLLE